MPFFPGERLLTSAEVAGDYYREALPFLQQRIGTIQAVQFRVVPTKAHNFLIARTPGPPRERSTLAPPANPEQWWVYDADRDGAEAWVPQATFNAVGYIDYSWMPGGDAFEHFEHEAEAPVRRLDPGRGPAAEPELPDPVPPAPPPRRVSVYERMKSSFRDVKAEDFRRDDEEP